MVSRKQISLKSFAGTFDKFAKVVKKADLNKLPFNAELHEFKHAQNILAKDSSLKKAMHEVLAEPLAKSTVKSYEYVWRDFEKFCSREKYSLNRVLEQALVHFLFKMHQENVGLAYFQKIIPAIRLRCDLLSKDFSCADTPYVKKVMAGCKRLAAKKKSPIKKANAFPVTVLKALVGKYVLPYQLEPGRIDAKALRSIFRAVIQYFTFCRYDCFNKLQSKHFRDHGDSIEITFPSAKNDQLHEGKSTFLVANNSAFCPVNITKIYFKRMNMRMDQQDESYINCRLGNKNGLMFPIKNTQISYSTAVKHTRDLLQENGFDSIGISEKSAKMEGVTQTLNSGATLEEVMWLGRWATLSIPNQYKINSREFKKSIASKVPS